MDKQKVTHSIKTESRHFQEVLNGNKRAEIRFNDRDYNRGDVIEQHEIDESGTETGRTIAHVGTNVIYGPDYGVKDGWCVISLGRCVSGTEAQEVERRNCHDVILGITQLAMMNREIIHIGTRYAGHVDLFDVRVFPNTENYEKNSRTKPLLDVDISLARNRYEDNATPLQQLLELEDKLLELIAEAKDKAEVTA